ncbi:uncharacterized protein LOC103502964 [Cucumis melo]|uniref:Uncharacterized protein LOC103502964 n=1 Tax=Cucumis melo TaxID=3656 RepID=A0A1S3CNL0_CUCME|nr:uncharacterized protein LOC103502964 [Cucumis melo]
MAAPASKLLRNFCITLVLSLILLVVLVLVLAFTVFKPQRPIIVVDSVSLLDLNVALTDGVDLNLSINVDLTVENPNKVAFEYSKSTAVVIYRGEKVGEAPIPGGRLPGKGTEKMNLTLTIMGERMLGRSEVFSDVVSGQLSISTLARLAGKVKVMGVVKIHVVASTSCDLIIDVKNGSFGDQLCQFRTRV